MSINRAEFAQKQYRKAVANSMRNNDITRAEYYEKKFNNLTVITGVSISI